MENFFTLELFQVFGKFFTYI